MKLALANKFRSEMVEKVKQFLLEEVGEDLGQINSNTINFPFVIEEEEGWCEIVVKVTKDDGDDGYLKREEYEMNLKEKEEKAKAKAEEKARKIERDKKVREEKKKAKEGI